VEGDTRADGSTLSSYLGILRRRKWIVILCTLLVPLIAFILSSRQEKLYESTAEVYVSRQNIASALTGIEDATLIVDERRAADTQARLAETPAVAKATLAGLGITDMTADELLDELEVSPLGDTDILGISIVDPDPERARQLTDSVAGQFVAYRARLDTAALRKARQEARATLTALRAQDKEGSDLYRSLEQKEQELATLEALSTERVSVVRPAGEASQVAPQPVRNAALGLFLGLVLGAGLAFLVEALDTRVRSASEIGLRLGLPLLARIPAPPRKLAREDRLVMLANPTSSQAEAFRMLRTNLDFVELDSDARTLLVTSALEQEGKSTTAANLAVALVRAGRRVALVDLDLRRPYLERFFELRTTPGITDVALGRTPLEEALQRVDLGTGHRSARPLSSGQENGRSEQGLLDVLTSGPIPPDPGEFVGTRRLAQILTELRGAYETVLLDSPPLLRVGDAMTLSTRADGMIVVTRLNLVRRPMLVELRRLLDASQISVLGFVVTDADTGKRDDTYGYGYSSGYGYSYGEREADGTAPAREGRKEPVEDRA
jgi:Mrp family chromosome partitioning ATPase/capsular polysaccharide biosynthesis protein